MTRIPKDIREMIEQSIYLPMAVTIFNRDLSIIQKSPFKLHRPYLAIVEESLRLVQNDLAAVRKELHKRNIKVHEVERDEAFTLYSFLYNGYEEKHNYFNPRIRNKVSELMEDYLFKPQK
ncbi:hypothetical protein [Metabacillus sediminilitoris]|uniref:YhjD n=1 Tax=Metabacillus sediminilitoris TaxID=2567941 RepID=A0A4S4BY92_9BACI|nr:hypothetical protein [Metabacillus sediminilitoris]QGQ44596.1 hypothetical protein GMB29_04545 [Metabacillus sediminilitoris]THF80223.1 hypothetical protein E6W99_11180 [Metabacillus sediminilitoris]